MTNVNTGCSRFPSAAARSASESIEPSDCDVSPSTSSVAAIAKTPSVKASVRRAETVASGWLVRRIMRTA